MGIIKKVAASAVLISIGSFVVGRGLLLVYGASSKVLDEDKANVIKEKSYIYPVNDVSGLETDVKSYFSSSVVSKDVVSAHQKRMKEEDELMAAVKRVENYYALYDSPMIGASEYLVRTAKAYGVDYRLIVAISVVESGAGRHCFKLYNAFGYGNYEFNSFEEAILKVIQGLRVYYNNGLNTPSKIAPVYNPVTPDSWSAKVSKIMEQL